MDECIMAAIATVIVVGLFCLGFIFPIIWAILFAMLPLALIYSFFMLVFS